MSVWRYRAFCECGFSDEPSFGSIWFTQGDYPVCPKCGESSSKFKMQTVRWVKTGPWWNRSGHWEKKP